MNLQKINKKLAARFGGAVRAKLADGCIVLSGHVKTWQEVVVAGQTTAEKYSTVHVVNDLTCDEVKEQPIAHAETSRQGAGRQNAPTC